MSAESVVSSSVFCVSVSGQIESAQFLGFDNIYCKYCYKYGNDWSVASGLEDGVSQITRISEDNQLFKRVPMFVPQSSSLIQRWTSWFSGRKPEFIDPKVVAQSEGREVIRVSSNGYVNVVFNVVLKDFQKYGFTVQ
ncbi:unnamed protein product [Oppiella nova]|uniref:B9 domain-containing protein 1 n=1 Tax=Oppiella nova TaxID=334625 RepID=A0A7R9M380_9ACAR|nr:unnamed protein product [Oppiella nova]CAG2169927.1 unnamed protein product [Oppiella nova]